MDNLSFFQTKDGSYTVINETINEAYHSKNGALQESLHIFINCGFNYHICEQKKENVSILEIGFGTGLNAFQTLIEATNKKVKVIYTGIEILPLPFEALKNLFYTKNETKSIELLFEEIHNCEWDIPIQINEYFTLIKVNQDLKEYLNHHNSFNFFDVIYFDAFSPEKQPELWTSEIFNELFKLLKSNGTLVTYSSKGIVKQALREAGFEVNRKKGPLGKRHILLAKKS